MYKIVYCSRAFLYSKIHLASTTFTGEITVLAPKLFAILSNYYLNSGIETIISYSEFYVLL
jgi:hypothetical protein